jgi:hypothetical protein
MHFARETAGAARTRLSLRPLLSRRVKDDANLGRIAPRERERLSEAGAYPKMFSLFENCLPPPSSLHTVIPGRRAAGEPGIHNHHREYGFRARAKKALPE